MNEIIGLMTTIGFVVGYCVCLIILNFTEK
jgi:hypothetical protein